MFSGAAKVFIYRVICGGPPRPFKPGDVVPRKYLLVVIYRKLMLIARNASRDHFSDGYISLPCANRPSVTSTRPLTSILGGSTVKFFTPRTYYLLVWAQPYGFDRLNAASSKTKPRQVDGKWQLFLAVRSKRTFGNVIGHRIQYDRGLPRLRP